MWDYYKIWGCSIQKYYSESFTSSDKDKSQNHDEYLLNVICKIFIVTHSYQQSASSALNWIIGIIAPRSIRSRDWVFGQFEEHVLFASLFLLDRARMPLDTKADPVQVFIVETFRLRDDEKVVSLVLDYWPSFAVGSCSFCNGEPLGWWGTLGAGG